MGKKNKEPNGRKKTTRIETEKAFLRKRKVNAKREVSKIENKAEEYVTNKKKIERLLNEVFEKAEKSKSLLGKILEDLIVLFRLVKAWTRGKYSRVPVRTIILIIATLLYFVNPFDVIPDFIPVIGYVDDATMIAAAIQSIRGDLTDFKRWEKS